MPESEPSAPLPDAHAGCKPALYDNALAAAIERAERAERERDSYKAQLFWVDREAANAGLGSVGSAAVKDLARQRDQARAQLAKVREVVTSGGLMGDIRATLGPVGATEVPADPCRGGCGPGYRYGDDGCRHTTEAKP